MTRKNDLARAPLGKLIRELHRKGSSGVLHLESGEQKTWIYFQAGEPAGVYSPNAEVYLGMIMQELGLIDQNTFNDSLMKMAKSGKLQGQVLLEMEAIDEQQLARALSVQHVRKISQLFSIKEGTFKFDKDAQMPERRQPHPVHHCGVVYQGIVNHFDEADLERHLKPLAGMNLGAGPDLGKAREHLHMGQDELEDLTLLAQHRTVDDFANRAKSGKMAGRMIILALYWCDLLLVSKPGEAPAAMPSKTPAKPSKPATMPSKPPVPTSNASTGEKPGKASPKAASSSAQGKVKKSGPPPGQGAKAAPASAPDQDEEKTPVPAGIKALVDKKYTQARRRDFFALLECTLESKPKEMEVNYKKLTKTFHPDRYAKYEDRELSLRLERVMVTLTEAFQTLSDSQSRSDFLNLQIGAGTRPTTLNPDAAKVAFEKAKVFIQKKSYKEAHDSLALAVRLDPKNILYRVRHIWMGYVQIPEPDREKQEQVKRELLKLFDMSPSIFWLNRQLALICAQLGQKEDHKKYLERSQRIRPNDIENNRDLRLMEMRQEKAGASKKGGLFGLKKG